MIKKIRLQNLRSLKDTGWIELKPLTILIGTNSSGKSTFLRWFPLMAQSAATNLRVPIKWNDDSMVDFGDFSSSLNRNANENEGIVFSFEIETQTRRFRRKIEGLDNSINRTITYEKFQISLHYKDSPKGTFISKIICHAYDHILEIKIDNPGAPIKFSVDDRECELSGIGTLPGWRYTILPTICFIDKNKDINFSLHEEIGGQIADKLYKYCGERLKHKEKLRGIIRYWDPDEKIFLENIKKFDDVKTLKKTIRKWTIQSKDFLSLYDQIYVFCLLTWLDRLNQDIVSMFEGVDYIAPLRAAGQRYYRNVGLQVDKIDPYGNNLGEFLESLTLTQKQSYDRYLENVLGIKITLRKGMGNQSIEIVQDGDSSNISDVGFGYSQILPIITKLWLAKEKGSIRRRGYGKNDRVLTAIEQPELHLHPAMQGKLTDACLKAVLSNNDEEVNENYNTDRANNVRMIIETHSPTIVNRIGRRIHEGHISNDDVQILVFEKSRTNHDTHISTVKYGEDGLIEEWPYGFFNPEEDIF